MDIKSKAVQCQANGLSLRFTGVAIDSLIQNDSTTDFIFEEIWHPL